MITHSDSYPLTVTDIGPQKTVPTLLLTVPLGLEMLAGVQPDHGSLGVRLQVRAHELARERMYLFPHRGGTLADHACVLMFHVLSVAVVEEY